MILSDHPKWVAKEKIKERDPRPKKKREEPSSSTENLEGKLEDSAQREVKKKRRRGEGKTGDLLCLILSLSSAGSARKKRRKKEKKEKKKGKVP